MMNNVSWLAGFAGISCLLAVSTLAPRGGMAQLLPHPNVTSPSFLVKLLQDSKYLVLSDRMGITDNRPKFREVRTAGSYPSDVGEAIATVTHLSDPYNQGGDQFGFSVALSADGSTALIGAWVTPNLNNGTVGKVYVFDRVNGVWSATPSVTFENPLSIPGMQFGDVVMLSADGSTALISDGYSPLSSQTNNSRVYIYTRKNGVWALVPTAALMDPDASDADCFGCSGIALSADGSVALIGAQNVAVNGSIIAGKAYLFASNNGTWPTTPVATFTDPGAVQYDSFGYSVALSADGGTALVGASQLFGYARAFVYEEENGNWSLAPIVTFNNLGAANGNGLGLSVALSADGTEAVVGTRAVNNDAGDAYIFTAINNIWSSTPMTIFDDPDANAGDNFGSSVSLSGDGSTALIGAPNATTGGGGAVYVFTMTNDLWAIKPVTTIIDPGSSSYDAFGYSVSLSADGSVALVGSPQPTGAALPPPNPPPPNNGPGQAYIYEASNSWGNPNPPPTGGSGSSSGGGAFSWLSVSMLLGMLISRRYSIKARKS